MSAAAVATFTTDFGTCDTYVAQMKGALLSLVRELEIIDVTHDIPPGDIQAGAFALEAILPHFPADTLHLAVVDPGVGGTRRPLAVRTSSCLAVGPDNGLLTPVLRLEGASAFEIRGGRFRRKDPAPTFHGRDLFVPACAHLLCGGRLDELGPMIDDPCLLAAPILERPPRGLRGEVVSVDRFGNLITSIRAEDVEGNDPACLRITVAGYEIVGLTRTYAEATVDGLIAVIGSGGRLEVALANGSARDHAGVVVGDRVDVRW